MAVRRPRPGWNRIMVHSLVQQLIRQDICYYMFHVFYRPDHSYRLVSFPYYTEITQDGDISVRVGFRIDCIVYTMYIGNGLTAHDATIDALCSLLE